MTDADWKHIVNAFTDEWCVWLAGWRGYDVGFVHDLRDHRIIGLFEGKTAFPVMSADGCVCGLHYRMDDGSWRYDPEGTSVTPLILGDSKTADTVWVFESQWDAFAVLDKYNLRLDDPFFSQTAIFMTRGAGNSSWLGDLGPKITSIVVWSQNDDAGKRLVKSVGASASCPVWVVSPPSTVKDFNEWTLAGATADDLTAAFEAAVEVPRPSAPVRDAALPIVQELPGITLPSGGESITECAGKLFPIIAAAEVLFSRGGKVMELAPDDRGNQILRPVSPQGFRSRMEQFAGFWVWRAGANREPVLKPTVPSEDHAKALLESRGVNLLPKIKAVMNCPVLMADGAEECHLVTSGYDAASGLLVTAGGDPPDVPLAEAVAKLRELHQDFDFQTPGDLSRALASMLTPALKLGGHITGTVPADVAEADASQSGKTFRGKLIAAVYNEQVSLVTQKQGGVGSDDETFNEALVRGHPFIQFDNRRGKLDSKHLESFLTANGSFPARVVRHGTIYVDPEAYFIFLSSNGVETTPDFANRSSIIRIRKRETNHCFAKYPEGDVLDHVRANQAYILGCVFAIIKAWLEQGKPRTEEPRHDFRVWCQSLDWIVQHVLNAEPLMDGHEVARQRVSNPALTFVRKIAIAVEQGGLLGSAIPTKKIYEIAMENEIDIPSYHHSGGEVAALKIIGGQLNLLFKGHGTDSLGIEGYTLSRSEKHIPRSDGNGCFPQKFYTISRGCGGGLPQQPHQAPPMPQGIPQISNP
jgi:hypothetical protein